MLSRSVTHMYITISNQDIQNALRAAGISTVASRAQTAVQ